MSNRQSDEAIARAALRYAHDNGFFKGRRYSRDSEPNEQFKREELAGPGEDDDHPHSDSHPALAEMLEQLGVSPEQIERCCLAAGHDQDQATDGDDPDTALREYLAGRLNDDEIEQAIALAQKDRAALTKDSPPLFSGRPRVGGGADPIVRNAATGARDQALAAVRRIAIDNSIGVQNFGEPAVNTGRVGASDSVHTSSRSMASFAQRWPSVARIRRA